MSKRKNAVRRTATVMAAAGALVMSSGIALIIGAAPAHAATKVNICHATSSDTNPYVFIQVDDDSSKLQAHLMHREDPNKKWKSDGTWNNVAHSKGDPKPDLIGSYVDENQVAHDYDGDITSESCEAAVTEIETTASASFTDPACANDNTPSYATEGEHVTFELDGVVAPGESVAVTATVDDGYTFADDAQSLVFEHTFGGVVDCSITEPPEEPEPEVTTPTPTVVHAGLVGTVEHSDRTQQGLALLLAGMIVMVMAAGLGLVQPYGGKSQN